MKKPNFFLSFLTLLTVLCITSHLSAATRGLKVVSKDGQDMDLYKDYRAVVVGVSDYEHWPNLPNAVNDAIEVADKLKRMGFHVKLVRDPTYREMRTVITDMVYKAGREYNRGLLFYYAGHGETEILADGKKMGYIIPRDCPLLGKDPAGFANHSISMREIESTSLKIRSKHVLMLFDSCFSGALFSLVRAAPEDITEKTDSPVRQYITAGREDEAVPDKSMFKRCFLIGLNGDADLTGDGYITGSELGMYLSDKVVNYTHRQQHPQYGKINNPDLDRGDFVFALKIPSTPKPPALVQSGGVRDYDKIIKERESNRKKWDAWQKQLETDVAKVERYDKSGALNEKEKAEAWEGLLASYSADNPYSVKDDEYREKAKERNLYWKGYKKSGKLFVDTTPPGSRIRILNIGPKFYQGMELRPGRYHVETSKQGYETKKMWVQLDAEEDKKVEVRLEQLQASIQPKSIATNTRQPSSTSNVSNRDDANIASVLSNPSYSRPSSSTSDVINQDDVLRKIIAPTVDVAKQEYVAPIAKTTVSKSMREPTGKPLAPGSLNLNGRWKGNGEWTDEGGRGTFSYTAEIVQNDMKIKITGNVLGTLKGNILHLEPKTTYNPNSEVTLYYPDREYKISQDGNTLTSKFDYVWEIENPHRRGNGSMTVTMIRE